MSLYHKYVNPWRFQVFVVPSLSLKAIPDQRSWPCLSMHLLGEGVLSWHDWLLNPWSGEWAIENVRFQCVMEDRGSNQMFGWCCGGVRWYRVDPFFFSLSCSYMFMRYCESDSLRTTHFFRSVGSLFLPLLYYEMWLKDSLFLIMMIWRYMKLLELTFFLYFTSTMTQWLFYHLYQPDPDTSRSNWWVEVASKGKARTAFHGWETQVHGQLEVAFQSIRKHGILAKGGSLYTDFSG